MKIKFLAPLCALVVLRLGAAAPFSSRLPLPSLAATLGDGFDQHWLMPDEYIVLEEAYKAGSSWQPAWVAKCLTEASPATKHEAEFFIVGGSKKGTKVWTRHFFKTRPAKGEDLKLGRIALALDGGKDEEELYPAPKDRDAILENNFFIGTINDTSELYKHYLQLSGYKVRPEGLRVIVAK